MGLVPSLSRDWIHWLRRDRWFSLWWCLPGAIILASALLPFNRDQKFLGLILDQWAGILMAMSLLGIASLHSRHVTRKDGRPPGMIRELRRTYGMTGQGLWFGIAFAFQFLIFIIWSKQHQLGFEPFWTGLFLLWGSTCLVAVLATKAWILLGFAFPFLSYGLCLPLARNDHTMKGVLFGMMFIAVALCFSAIQAWQIRNLETQDDSDRFQRA
jgi:hypothetical protein